MIVKCFALQLLGKGGLYNTVVVVAFLVQRLFVCSRLSFFWKERLNFAVEIRCLGKRWDSIGCSLRSNYRGCGI